ncbi:MAG: ATP-binding protein [Bacilli bacterium]|nr:ATP-binding protein [Bacilli bacterium]
MNELSLHILDICQNSIKANASLIQIIIEENTFLNQYKIIIKDNGYGMNKKTLSSVADPFFTTRLTRKVGLGISLFKMAAEMTEGSFVIESEENIGTVITAYFSHNHIDRAPLGDIEETMSILILNEKGIDIYYEHNYNDKTFIFDTREIKKVLEDIPLTDYSVIMWIKNNIKNGIENIQKEESN